MPGRFEPVDEGQDFARARGLRAHARLARERAARRARDHPRARCTSCSAPGGDRDRGKRPLMGDAAARARRPRDRHLRQPALRGPRARSSTRCWRAPAASAEREVDRRARDRARRSRRADARGRRRDRRQGPRAGPGVRGRPQGAVRRRDRGARGAAGACRAPEAARDRSLPQRLGGARPPAASSPPGERRARAGPRARGDRLARGRARTTCSSACPERAPTAASSRRRRSTQGAWGVLVARARGRRAEAAARWHCVQRR